MSLLILWGSNDLPELASPNRMSEIRLEMRSMERLFDGWNIKNDGESQEFFDKDNLFAHLKSTPNRQRHCIIEEMIVLGEKSEYNLIQLFDWLKVMSSDQLVDIGKDVNRLIFISHRWYVGSKDGEFRLDSYDDLSREDWKQAGYKVRQGKSLNISHLFDRLQSITRGDRKNLIEAIDKVAQSSEDDLIELFDRLHPNLMN